MSFDACEHKIRLMIIEFGRALRKVQGLPEENNVTVLYKEVLKAMGIVETPMTSRDINHLPAPHEMKDDQGQFTIPRKDCPQCGRKEGLSLVSICPSCTDSEGGKYHSMWTCIDTDAGCGSRFYIDTDGVLQVGKSEKFMTQVLNELGINFGTGTKEEMGIKTITDAGIK